MKKTLLYTLTLALSVSLAATTALAAPQTFRGTISDSMCKRHHMMPGKSDAQCIEECVKAGSGYVLLVGDKVYTLNAAKGVLSPYAGKSVAILGELKGETIQVTAVH